ncbi:MAG: hypothetical protein HRU13_14365 [Phycisphaerales bacterium]|nr:hypothetical protein [Phycisphaerales bacterium]
MGTELQSIDMPNSQRKRRMDSMCEYLRQRDVSPELSDIILDYYDYCMLSHITEDDESVLTEIHYELKEKLGLEVNQQLLTEVPSSEQLPDGLLLMLIHSLVSRIYLPDERVSLIGEKASDMLFVVRGDLEKLNQYGVTQGFLTDGAFFGFRHGQQRGVGVRAACGPGGAPGGRAAQELAPAQSVRCGSMCQSAPDPEAFHAFSMQCAVVCDQRKFHWIVIDGNYLRCQQSRVATHCGAHDMLSGDDELHEISVIAEAPA